MTKISAIGTTLTSLVAADLEESERASDGVSGKITAANKAKSFRDLAFSGARVYKSTGLTGLNASGAGLTLTWDAERYDTDSYHNTGANTDRLTCPTTGYYDASVAVFLSNVSISMYVRLVINKYDSGGVLQEVLAVSVCEISSTVIGPSISCATIGANLTAGDYLSAILIVETDTAVDIGATGNHFAIKRVG